MLFHAVGYILFYAFVGFCHVSNALKGEGDVSLKGVGDKNSIEALKRIHDMVLAITIGKYFVTQSFQEHIYFCIH